MENPKQNAGVCKVFKVTNRCGDGWPNEQNWCNNKMSYHECKSNPKKCDSMGNTNKYGYAFHFDLMDANLQVSKGLGWDNAEVTFEEVSCSANKSLPANPFSKCHQHLQTPMSILAE